MKTSFIPLLLVIAAVAARADEPVNVKNAALLYWQAFTLMPTTPTNLPHPVWKGSISTPVVRHLAEADTSLGLLRDAARVEHCDWGLPWHRGLNTPLAHLGKARQLTQLACLEIRHLTARGKPGDALELANAALVLARRVGLDSALLGAMFQITCEDMVLRTIAWHAGNFPGKQLQTFANGLSKLPPPLTFAQVLQSENHFSLDRLPRAPRNPDPQSRIRQSLRSLLESTPPRLSSNLFNLEDPADSQDLLKRLETMKPAHYAVLRKTLGLPPQKEFTAQLRIVIDGIMAVPEADRPLVAIWLADQVKSTPQKALSFPAFVEQLRKNHQELAAVASLPYSKYCQQAPVVEAKIASAAPLVQQLRPHFARPRTRFETARILFDLFQTGITAIAGGRRPAARAGVKVAVEGDQITCSTELQTPKARQTVLLAFHAKPVQIDIEKENTTPPATRASPICHQKLDPWIQPRDSENVAAAYDAQLKDGRKTYGYSDKQSRLAARIIAAAVIEAAKELQPLLQAAEKGDPSAQSAVEVLAASQPDRAIVRSVLLNRRNKLEAQLGKKAVADLLEKFE